MSGNRPVTLRDVAKQAGVSTMTVSAVLNGKATKLRISAETQARVSEIARRVGYQPNAVARSLRGQVTNVIGLYSGLGYLNASNPFLAELIGGIQEGCELHGKDLLLHGPHRGQSTDDIYAKILDGRLDGLLVQASESDPLVAQLAASRMPVVALADAISSVASVVVDDADGMRQIIVHLAERGHRHILYIGPKLLIESARRRREAIVTWAERLGITVTEPVTSIGNNFDSDLMDHWLIGPLAVRPSAVVAWSDGVALEVVRYCRQRGLFVPEDLAVTGFDGFPPRGSVIQPLTTIRAPWDDVGRAAVALLTDIIDGRLEAMETVIPVSLIHGATS